LKRKFSKGTYKKEVKVIVKRDGDFERGYLKIKYKVFTFYLEAIEF
jgi:hypothetical protein